MRFRRVRGPKDALNPRRAHREHRKLLTVDGRLAFVGGWNIGVLFTSWRDTHLRVRGDEVYEMERSFADFWNTHRSEDLAEIPPVRERQWNPVTAFHVNDPYSHTFPIRDVYLRAVARANERVYITTAYFTPGPAFRRAMVKAARRGVDVQVLIPERSNHALVDWLGRSYLGEFGQACLVASRRFTLKTAPDENVDTVLYLLVLRSLMLGSAPVESGKWGGAHALDQDGGADH